MGFHVKNKEQNMLAVKTEAKEFIFVVASERKVCWMHSRHR